MDACDIKQKSAVIRSRPDSPYLLSRCVNPVPSSDRVHGTDKVKYTQEDHGIKYTQDILSLLGTGICLR